MAIFAQGFYQGIEWIYGVTGDYGIAIVLITIAIRILLLPLNVLQRKQLENQRDVQTEVEKLKIKYKNNQQKMNEELQKLYQEKGFGGGCLVTLIQFPIMMCLYNGIRMTTAAGAVTVLLPWVSSLLARDRTFFLPIVTLIVQFLPQLYPYIGYFKALKLQKITPSMACTLLLINGMFAFMIPSGVGLYYFVSGLFSAMEQLAVHIFRIRKLQAE